MRGFGDDADLGWPMSERLKDPFPVEPELLDVSIVASKSSNRLVSKFGMLHLKQHQLMSVFSRAWAHMLPCSSACSPYDTTVRSCYKPLI